MLSTQKRIRGDILRFSKVCNRLVGRESDVGMWFCNWFWSYVRFTSGEQWVYWGARDGGFDNLKDDLRLPRSPYAERFIRLEDATLTLCIIYGYRILTGSERKVFNLHQIYISNLSSLSNNCCPSSFFSRSTFSYEFLITLSKKLSFPSFIHNSHNYFSLSNMISFGKTYRTTLIYFTIIAFA